MQVVRLRLSKAQDIPVATLKIWTALGQNQQHTPAHKLSVFYISNLDLEQCTQCTCDYVEVLMEVQRTAKVLANFALAKFACYHQETTNRCYFTLITVKVKNATMDFMQIITIYPKVPGKLHIKIALLF